MRAASAQPLLAAESITLRHPGPGAAVLSDVSMAIHAGEVVTVVGPNGAGKSTLIRALLGLLPLDQGRVSRAPGLRIGYVPQRMQIDPAMPLTVRRFLSLPRRVSDRQAAAALARTDVPALGARQLGALSGGQFQRVLLARALLQDPQLLVLDEPTQGLDQPGIVGFYRLIDELRAETGAAVLLVSHDLMVVMRASDRVICLNGHVCCEGSPAHVSADPAYRALFGDQQSAETLALYSHHHDHSHDAAPPDHPHSGPGCTHDHSRSLGDD